MTASSWTRPDRPLSNTSLLWVVRDDEYRDSRGEIGRTLVGPNSYVQREENLENRFRSRESMMTLAMIFEGTERKLLEEGPAEEEEMEVEGPGTLEVPVETQSVEGDSENVEKTVEKTSRRRKAKIGPTRRSSRLAGKRKAEESQPAEAKRKKDVG